MIKVCVSADVLLSLYVYMNVDVYMHKLKKKKYIYIKHLGA